MQKMLCWKHTCDMIFKTFFKKIAHNYIYSYMFSPPPPHPAKFWVRAGPFIPTARTGQLATSLVRILNRLQASLSRDVYGRGLMLCVYMYVCICSHAVLVLMLYLFSKPCHLKDIDVAYCTRLKQDGMTEVTERKKERWIKTRPFIEG